MASAEKVSLFLCPFVPEAVLKYFSEAISRNNLLLQITRRRKTKLGTFVRRQDRPPLITVNGDLHPVHFALVLAHELAHFNAWNNNRNKTIKPHGKEWKSEFSLVLGVLLDAGIFPPHIRDAVTAHMGGNFSSHNAEYELSNALCRLNLPEPSATLLSDIPVGGAFEFRGAHFIKIENRRKKCIAQRTDGRSRNKYLMHLLLEVTKK